MEYKKTMKAPKKSKQAPKKSEVSSECPGWIKGKHIGPHRGLKMIKDSNK